MRLVGTQVLIWSKICKLSLNFQDWRTYEIYEGKPQATCCHFGYTNYMMLWESIQHFHSQRLKIIWVFYHKTLSNRMPGILTFLLLEKVEACVFVAMKVIRFCFHHSENSNRFLSIISVRFLSTSYRSVQSTKQVPLLSD